MTRHRFTSPALAAGLALALTAAAPAALAALTGPIGTYYVTNPGLSSPGYLYAITGDIMQQRELGYDPDSEAAIAIVGDSIRTTSAFSGSSGGEYKSAPALTVSTTGTTYLNQISNGIYDGTSDGQHNYTVQFVTSGGGYVIQTDLDWSNPTPLFSVPTYFAGITYDRTNGSLWLSDVFSQSIYNVDLGGDLLSSFSTAFSLSALAMDQDHTLWGYDIN